MYNNDIPSRSELPSTMTLIRSTIIAAISATVILVTVVLPAEFGIDPTGIGRIAGLQKMGEIKVSLAAEAAAETNAEATPAEQTPKVPEQTEIAQPAQVPEAETVTETVAEPAETLSTALATAALPKIRQSHEMTITLVPNEGREIKVALQKGKKVRYEWWTDKGRANYDIHGDSEELNIDYHNYSKGSEKRSEGTLEAAFDGYHGWFWRNRTNETLSVTIRTTGEYTEIKEVK